MSDERDADTGRRHGWEARDSRDPETVKQYSQLAEQVMKRQAALGLRVAAVFIVMIVGLPLFNLYYPKAAATPIFGFTLTWLFLGIGFFPITWLLSSYFVRESDRIEAEAAQSPVVAALTRAEAQVVYAPGSPDREADVEKDAQ